MTEAGSTSVLPPVPLVSVAITAYNSEKWLPRALDSVLEQKTSFAFEIIVGDDCSQDGTMAVARSYQERYPDIVRVFDRPKNVGIQRNYYETFEHCRGKYIAWLDADDFWTDPEKLAVQTKTLEDDPSIAVCGHFVRWVTTDKEFVRMHPSMKPGRYGMEEMVKRNFLPSPSVVFRNGIQRELPEWYFDLAPITDWAIWILAARTGDIVMLDRVMADYTLTPNSAFTGQGQLRGSMSDARFYERVESILPVEFHRLARAEKGKRYEDISYLLRKQGSLTESRKAAVKAFFSPAVMDNTSSKTKTLAASLARELQGKISGKGVAAGK